MVTAPMCKVCGERHFGATHIWPRQGSPPSEVVEAIMPSIVAESRRVHRAVKANLAKLDAAIAPGPKRDRAAYMRTYRAKHHI